MGTGCSITHHHSEYLDLRNLVLYRISVGAMESRSVSTVGCPVHKMTLAGSYTCNDIYCYTQYF